MLSYKQDRERIPSEVKEAYTDKLRDGKRPLLVDIAFAIALLAALCAVASFVGRGNRILLISALLPLSGYLLLAGLERVLPTAGPRKSSKCWWMHLHIILANLVIGIPILGYLGAYAAWTIAKHLEINLGLIDLRFLKSYRLIGLLFSAGIVSAAASDFFYYWLHRAMHKSRILWQHHKMHHLDPEFDALTGERFHWLEHVFMALFVALPLTIFFTTDSVMPIGIASLVILYVRTISRVINHSNLRMQFGRASFLWVSSQTHRIHHSRLPEHQDKNFAAFFPLWDVLFGTYYAPKLNEFPPTGIEGEVEIESFWEAQIFTFREWWRLFQVWRFRQTITGGVPRAVQRKG